MYDDEIFMIKARRCKRCGGLLTSEQALNDGYGHVCKSKVDGELLEKKPIDGQMNFPGFTEPEPDERRHDEREEK